MKLTRRGFIAGLLGATALATSQGAISWLSEADAAAIAAEEEVALDFTKRCGFALDLDTGTVEPDIGFPTDCMAKFVSQSPEGLYASDDKPANDIKEYWAVTDHGNGWYRCEISRDDMLFSGMFKGTGKMSIKLGDKVWLAASEGGTIDGRMFQIMHDSGFDLNLETE